jgi:hypothetical protein
VCADGLLQDMMKQIKAQEQHMKRVEERANAMLNHYKTLFNEKMNEFKEVYTPMQGQLQDLQERYHDLLQQQRQQQRALQVPVQRSVDPPLASASAVTGAVVAAVAVVAALSAVAGPLEGVAPPTGPAEAVVAPLAPPAGPAEVSHPEPLAGPVPMDVADTPVTKQVKADDTPITKQVRAMIADLFESEASTPVAPALATAAADDTPVTKEVRAMVAADDLKEVDLGPTPTSSIVFWPIPQSLAGAAAAASTPRAVPAQADLVATIKAVRNKKDAPRLVGSGDEDKEAENKEPSLQDLACTAADPDSANLAKKTVSGRLHFNDNHHHHHHARRRDMHRRAGVPTFQAFQQRPALAPMAAQPAQARDALPHVAECNNRSAAAQPLQDGGPLKLEDLM